MRSNMYFSLILCSLLLLGACSDGSDSSSAPNPYAADDLWICKPGTTPDICLELDQTTTYIYSNTSQAVFEHTPAVDPGFDCFFLHPTTDLSKELGNAEHSAENAMSVENVVSSYSLTPRFTEICNVYIPLYRQMTVGTLNLEGGYRNTEYYDIAFSDVNDAFNQYLQESGNRPFVLMGHSQGSSLLMELMLQRIDNNEKLRRRLISALVIGSLGRFERPEGALVPDSFENIPLCTHMSQTGCIIAYDSIAAGGYEEREAVARPCVNPSLLGSNPGVLEYTLVQESSLPGLPWPEGIETPWVAEVDLYTASCEPDGFLAISVVVGDEREPIVSVDLYGSLFEGILHIWDYNWAMGDLLRIVSTQAENMP